MRHSVATRSTASLSAPPPVPELIFYPIENSVSWSWLPSVALAGNESELRAVRWPFRTSAGVVERVEDDVRQQAAHLVHALVEERQETRLVQVEHLARTCTGAKSGERSYTEQMLLSKNS
jgi:hypothetical protein